MDRNTISGAMPGNLDLNVAYEDRDLNIYPEIGVNRANQRTSSLAGYNEIPGRNVRQRVTHRNQQFLLPSTMPAAVDDANTSHSFQHWLTSSNSPLLSSNPPVIPGTGSHMSDGRNLGNISRNVLTQNLLVPGNGMGIQEQNPVVERNFSRNNSSNQGPTSVHLSPLQGFPQHDVHAFSQNNYAAGTHLTTASVFPSRNLAQEYDERISPVGNQPMNRMSGSGSSGWGSSYPLAQQYEERFSQTNRHMNRSSGSGFTEVAAGSQLGHGYEERLTPVINQSRPRSSGSRAQGGSNMQHLSASVTTEGMFQPGPVNMMAIQIVPGTEVLMLTAQGRNAALSLPDMLQSLTTAQRRRRLAQIIRQWVSTRNEEAGGDDVHGEMQLDINNLSYEELLALEERIGNVNAGLSEEAIITGLERLKYCPFIFGHELEEESCCICQEIYIHGEDVSKLGCGHIFHFDCIKPWLMQKNTCPICKMTALGNRVRVSN